MASNDGRIMKKWSDSLYLNLLQLMDDLELKEVNGRKREFVWGKVEKNDINLNFDVPDFDVPENSTIYEVIKRSHDKALKLKEVVECESIENIRKFLEKNFFLYFCI